MFRYSAVKVADTNVSHVASSSSSSSASSSVSTYTDYVSWKFFHIQMKTIILLVSFTDNSSAARWQFSTVIQCLVPISRLVERSILGSSRDLGSRTDTSGSTQPVITFELVTEVADGGRWVMHSYCNTMCSQTVLGLFLSPDVRIWSEIQKNRVR